MPMARRLRIQYRGAMYHGMNRGDQREAIFRDDEDRQRFLSTLGEACLKTEWQVHAYCRQFGLLISNSHFELGMTWAAPGGGKKVSRFLMPSRVLFHRRSFYLFSWTHFSPFSICW